MSFAAKAPEIVDSGETLRRARAFERLSGAPFLAAPLHRLGYDGRETWAWDNYRATALSFVQVCHWNASQRGALVRVLEIGGGRGPLFTPEEAKANGFSLTVNDIDAHELSLAPDDFEKARFDIAGALPQEFEGRFDLIISKMVLEHVRDAPLAWANMRALLAPGGVALGFHPTLFASPFLINWLMPERLTAAMLRRVFPNRHQGDYPKFPARYELCRANQEAIEPALQRAGFSQILVAPFWGHRYYRHFPVIRDLVSLVERIAEARDWRLLATYAYTIARR
jgi:SAM-dependent methyltransferase